MPYNVEFIDTSPPSFYYSFPFFTTLFSTLLFFLFNLHLSSLFITVLNLIDRGREEVEGRQPSEQLATTSTQATAATANTAAAPSSTYRYSAAAAAAAATTAATTATTTEIL